MFLRKSCPKQGKKKTKYWYKIFLSKYILRFCKIKNVCISKFSIKMFMTRNTRARKAYAYQILLKYPKKLWFLHIFMELIILLLYDEKAPYALLYQPETNGIEILTFSFSFYIALIIYFLLNDFKLRFSKYWNSLFTKLCSSVTYHDGLQPIKPPDHLITWSCEVTWWIKYLPLIKFYNTLNSQCWWRLWWWRRLALFLLARSIVRDSHQRKSITCGEQGLNMHRTWVQA